MHRKLGKGQRRFFLGAAIWIVCGLGAAPAQAQVTPQVDPGLKPYSNKTAKLEGKVLMGSSETLKKLVDLWIEGFRSHHRSLELTNELIKYTEASKAFTPGVIPIPEGANLVALSYPLSDREIQAIKANGGREPISIPVALDGLVVYVNHKNQELKGLTLAQVSKIFGATSNGESAITTWGQLGLNGSLGSRHLNVYTRDPESGTYAAFKEMALHGREQVKTALVQPGSRSVALEVGSDELGIGYAAMGFATRKVKVVPLAKEEGQPFVEANNHTVASGEYPLARALYMNILPEPNGTLNPIVKEFLSYILSLDGQRVVMEDGFVPLPGRLIEQARLKLEGGTSAASLSMATSGK